MGRDPMREAPFFFTKSQDAVVPTGTSVYYPPGTQNYHYEMELVVALGGLIFEGGPEEGLKAVYAYACGLDMTRRDLQLEARERGRPWDLGKSFEQSAIIGLLHPRSETGPLESGRIELRVNDEIRQAADVRELIWPVGDVVSILSRYYQLGPGDVIFTGTPAGVGAVVPGDRLAGSIAGLSPVETRILDPVGKD